jgi:hypothetical protein
MSTKSWSVKGLSAGIEGLGKSFLTLGVSSDFLGAVLGELIERSVWKLFSLKKIRFYYFSISSPCFLEDH